MHRIGRTGRAGRTGVAVTLVDWDELHRWESINSALSLGMPEPVPGDSRSITYAQLQAEVCQAANYFTELGLTAGDRVAIYMPMVPEAIVSMLACARLGLTHSVVFAGFSPSALRQRVDDAEARLVITTDGQWRRGKAAPLKEAVDEALYAHGDVPHSVEHVLVVRRTNLEIAWTEGTNAPLPGRPRPSLVPHDRERLGRAVPHRVLHIRAVGLVHLGPHDFDLAVFGHVEVVRRLGLAHRVALTQVQIHFDTHQLCASLSAWSGSRNGASGCTSTSTRCAPRGVLTTAAIAAARSEARRKKGWRAKPHFTQSSSSGPTCSGAAFIP
ncbi:AMP-binding protein, partial [Micrococcus luteus]